MVTAYRKAHRGKFTDTTDRRRPGIGSDKSLDASSARPIVSSGRGSSDQDQDDLTFDHCSTFPGCFLFYYKIRSLTTNIGTYSIKDFVSIA